MALKVVSNCCFYCGDPQDVVTFTPAKPGEVQDKVCLSVIPCPKCTKDFEEKKVVALVEGTRLSKIDKAVRMRKRGAAEFIVRKVLSYPQEFIDEPSGKYLLIRDHSFSKLLEGEALALVLRLRYALMEPSEFAKVLKKAPAAPPGDAPQA